MEAEAKKTQLHGWHAQQGANMALFGEYEMPLWYPAGAKQEHLAVLQAAGIFDTSHMCSVMVQGAGALDLLQRCFSKDLTACLGPKAAPLVSGRSVYGVFLNVNGEVIDDAIVFQIGADDYMVVVNSGMGAPIAAHLELNNESDQVSIADLTDRLGKLDVQGPAAARILSGLLQDPTGVFDRFPYFAFKGHFDDQSTHADQVRLKDGTPILLSRTGYTGEFGFELFTAPEHFVRVWDAILEAGRQFDLMPCGLAARDSLRAGAVLPLSHQDIGPWLFLNNPWTFALPYTDDRSGFTKSFIGSDALLQAQDVDHTLPFAGQDLRKVSTADPAVVLDENGKQIGQVLTCATDMAIGRHDGRIYSVASPDKPAGFKPRGLCCGFVKVSVPAAAGQAVFLKDNRRQIEVEIVDDIRPARTARMALKNFL
jgi:aminomethyltransferase